MSGKRGEYDVIPKLYKIARAHNHQLNTSDLSFIYKTHIFFWRIMCVYYKNATHITSGEAG